MKQYTIELNDYSSTFIELMAKCMNTTPEILMKNFFSNHLIGLDSVIRNTFFVPNQSL